MIVCPECSMPDTLSIVVNVRGEIERETSAFLDCDICGARFHLPVYHYNCNDPDQIPSTKKGAIQP